MRLSLAIASLVLLMSAANPVQAGIVLSANILPDEANNTSSSDAFTVSIFGASDPESTTDVSTFGFGLNIFDVGGGQLTTANISNLSYVSGPGSSWSPDAGGTFSFMTNDVSLNGATIEISGDVWGEIPGFSGDGSERVSIPNTPQEIASFDLSIDHQDVKIDYEFVSDASVSGRFVSEGGFFAHTGNQNFAEASSNVSSFQSASFTVTPEPSSLCLLTFGGLAAIGYRRRRQTS